ncbi:TetR/AcrR family transcriptional regulator [Devosia chinhatensis]|uniref:TetR family transcriptional regulator n=1 Tax=Devosia chinhatensis TaxID=429727 RepID=A0A0F5FIK6_9HYPH|nr:TetR/AcrR family transcriptional regulator [Devosia chinhatensis]KKB08032.1 TetR family transcriptional regulator [Devosia chinhatensis]
MPRAGLSRDRLIEAAGTLADEKGFDALTLADLARHFDVRLPTLYSHIANAHDLRTGLAFRALTQLADRVETGIAGRSGRDALVAFAQAHLRFAGDHPGLFTAARYPLVPEDARRSDGMRLSRLSLAMLRSYGLVQADEVHAVRLVGSFVLGFSLLSLAGSFDHSAPDAETSFLRGLDALHATLSTWGSPPSL